MLLPQLVLLFLPFLHTKPLILHLLQALAKTTYVARMERTA